MNGKKRRLALVGAIAVVLLAAFASVLPGRGTEQAQAQSGGTPAIVNPFGCIVGNDGHVTRPAGSEIVIRQGYASTAIGGVYAFVKAQTTILSVNDGRMVDVSDTWSNPEPLAGFAGVTRVTYPTGVTIAAGESMRFTFAQVIDRPLTDPSDYDGDGTLDPPRPFKGLAFGGTCTVTGI